MVHYLDLKNWPKIAPKRAPFIDVAQAACKTCRFSTLRSPASGRVLITSSALSQARTAAYLLGMPLLGDFLEEGLSLLGYSCEEFEINRL